jgi:ketopantoate hydroxymethyltransferase
VRPYADVRGIATEALRAYADDVRSGDFGRAPLRENVPT